MVEDLKVHAGSVQEIARIPNPLKERFRTAFEVDADWLIRCAARRQKWIDMSQSLNLYLDRPSGRRLSEMYLRAWRSGLKTTYYLRTVGAGGVEASTLDVNRHGIQPRWMQSVSASASVRVERADAPTAPSCTLDDDCEACQ
jgi:ribonucleoside-diphosphate reductase alpha chain